MHVFVVGFFVRFCLLVFWCLFWFCLIFLHATMLHVNISIFPEVQPWPSGVCTGNLSAGHGQGSGASQCCRLRNPSSGTPAAPSPGLRWCCSAHTAGVYPCSLAPLTQGAAVSYPEIFSLLKYSGTHYSLSQATFAWGICMTIQMCEIPRFYNVCVVLEHVL